MNTPPARAARLLALPLALVIGASACSKDDTETSGTKSRTDPEATTTTEDQAEAERKALEAERQTVTDARTAAMDAVWKSLGPPRPNPDLPALAETHTGPRLEYERWRRSYDLEYRPGFAWVHPANSQHRYTVEGVTFPDNDPTADIAWVQSCLTDDMTLADAATGHYKGTLGVDTFRFTELMRREHGKWKVADRLEETYYDGATSCPTATPRPVGGIDLEAERAAVTKAREQAEATWVAWLANPDAAPPPADTHTADLLKAFGTAKDQLDVLHPSGHCVNVPNGTYDLSGDTRSGEISDCQRAWFIGQAPGPFGIVSYGTTTIKGTSQVKVESVAFQPDEAPQVAYLVTCRTYRLTRADRTDGTGLLFPNGTVRSTDVMQWADGKWKFAYRGGFTIDPPGGCA